MGLQQDLRDACRALTGSRRTSLAVILTLSLALGLNAALFSVINSVLLRPLPYPASDRLAAIGARWPALRIDRALLSARDVAALRRASAFEDVAAGTDIRQNLTGRGLAQQVVVGWVSDNFLSVLGATAEAGRLFAPGEPPGRAILSHEQAVTSFGSPAEAIGAMVQLDAHPYEIVGVLEPGFRLHAHNMPQTIDVWKVPDPWWQNGKIWDPSESGPQGIFTVIGRMRSGVSLERARGELAAVASQLRSDDPEAARRGLEFTGERLLQRIVGDVRQPLLLLWGAVGILLAIACANVTNLMLVRVEARRRDLAVRVALGAGQWRIFRLLVVESGILASAGAAAGSLFAIGAIRVIRRMDGLALARLDEVQLDWRVFAVSAAVTLGCTLLMGLAPFVTVLSARLSGNADVRTMTGSQRLTRVLVVVQIALSLVLLVAAGLLTTSLRRLASTNPGFDADHLLTFSVSLPGKKYTWPEGADRFHHELEDRIRALPGVENAGVIWPLPLSGGGWKGRYWGGEIGAAAPRVGSYRLVTPAYFDTLRLPIADGRNFGTGNPKDTVIVSRSLAVRAYPGQAAVGRRIIANPWGRTPLPFTIIAVADDAKMTGLREPADEALYFDSKGWAWTEFEIDVVIRTAGDPLSLARPVRTLLATMDPDVPMAEIKPMRAWVDAQLASNRTALWLVGAFGVVAALLSAVGLYGVLSYLVVRTQREIGIRLALGAERSRIYGLILRRGGRLVAIGLASGIALCLATSRLLVAYLYGVGSRDPATLTGVVLGFAVVAAAACYLPARRAASVAPVIVLRTE